jgi:hypothetical protein
MVQSAQKVGDKGREVRIWGRTSGGRPRGKVKLSGGSETAQIGVRTSDVDGEGDTAVSTSSEFDPVEDMVVIPIPPPVIHTLIPVEVPEAFIPPSLRTTPSPPYVASCEEDPVHDGVPEYWVDPGAGPS